MDNPPKNLQAYIDEQRKQKDVEGGCLSLMDGLLKLRVETDKKMHGENDDDDEDEDEDSTKIRMGRIRHCGQKVQMTTTQIVADGYIRQGKKSWMRRRKKAVSGKKAEEAAKAKRKNIGGG